MAESKYTLRVLRNASQIKRTGGSLTDYARALGLDRSRLYGKLAEYERVRGITTPHHETKTETEGDKNERQKSK